MYFAPPRVVHGKKRVLCSREVGGGRAKIDAWIWTYIKLGVGEEGSDLLGDGVRGFK